VAEVLIPVVIAEKAPPPPPPATAVVTNCVVAIVVLSVPGLCVVAVELPNATGLENVGVPVKAGLPVIVKEPFGFIVSAYNALQAMPIPPTEIEPVGTKMVVAYKNKSVILLSSGPEIVRDWLELPSEVVDSMKLPPPFG
jgi:hypothetical protein